MESALFDRETLLDLVVNLIPMAIILFFVIAFTAASPFGGGIVIKTIQLSLLVVPLVALAVVTYYTVKAVSAAERRESAEPEPTEEETDTKPLASAQQ